MLRRGRGQDGRGGAVVDVVIPGPKGGRDMSWRLRDGDGGELKAKGEKGWLERGPAESQTVRRQPHGAPSGGDMVHPGISSGNPEEESEKGPEGNEADDPGERGVKGTSSTRPADPASPRNASKTEGRTRRPPLESSGKPTGAAVAMTRTGGGWPRGHPRVALAVRRQGRPDALQHLPRRHGEMRGCRRRRHPPAASRGHHDAWPESGAGSL